MEKRASFYLLLIFSLILTMTFSSHVPVYAGNESQKIAKVFEKFRYQMVVDWDQEDSEFRLKAQRELEDALLALKAQGISELEILAYVKEHFLDEKSRAEYERLVLDLQKKNIHLEEVSALAMKFMKNNYREGVSFSSGGSPRQRAVMASGMIIMGVITYIVIKQQREDDCGDCADPASKIVSSSSVPKFVGSFNSTGFTSYFPGLNYESL